jgi:hypothetical protein
MLLAAPLDRAAEPVECGALAPVGVGPFRRGARSVPERQPRRLDIGRRFLEQEADREMAEDVRVRISPVSLRMKAEKLFLNATVERLCPCAFGNRYGEMPVVMRGR